MASTGEGKLVYRTVFCNPANSERNTITISQFDKEINELMRQGWKLYGTPIMGSTFTPVVEYDGFENRSKDWRETPILIQAMVKEVEA